jgi:hypothetical protein
VFRVFPPVLGGILFQLPKPFKFIFNPSSAYLFNHGSRNIAGQLWFMLHLPQFLSFLTQPANAAYFIASSAPDPLNCGSLGDSPPQVTVSKYLLHFRPISSSSFLDGPG